MAAVLAAVLLLVFRLSWLRPWMGELDAKRAAVAGKETALMQARREQADLTRARSEVDELGLGLDRLGPAPSGQEEVSALLRRLHVFAVESRLTIRVIRLQPASPGDLNAEWSYRLHLDGTYAGLTRFFRRVGGLSRLVTIDDVSIRAADPPGPGRTVAAECTATAFVVGGASAGPPGREEAG